MPQKRKGEKASNVIQMNSQGLFSSVQQSGTSPGEAKKSSWNSSLKVINLCQKSIN